MAATKVQANWTAVSFASSPITRVTSVSFNRGGSLTPFRGDLDNMPSVLICLTSDPSASITTADAGLLMSLLPGASGTFTATHKDAAAQTSGDIVYTLANAVVENVETSGSHGAYGTATLNLKAGAPDGVTNPLTFTRA